MPSLHHVEITQPIPSKHKHGSSNRHSNNAINNNEAFDDHDTLSILQSRHLYDQAIAHLHRHPLSAHTLDTHQNNTPLHNAIHANAPMKYIEALLTVHPAACTKCNAHSEWPIHTACHSVSFVTSPLYAEAIVMTLIRVFPRGLLCRDKRGETPLDILIRRGVRIHDRWGGVVVRVMRDKMKELMLEKKENDDYCDDTCRYEYNNCREELRDDDDGQDDPFKYCDEEMKRDGPQSLLSLHNHVEEHCVNNLLNGNLTNTSQEDSQLKSLQKNNHETKYQMEWHHDDDTITPRHRNGGQKVRKQRGRGLVNFFNDNTTSKNKSKPSPKSRIQTRQHEQNNREKTEVGVRQHRHQQQQHQCGHHESSSQHSLNYSQDSFQEQLHSQKYYNHSPINHSTISTIIHTNHSSDDTATLASNNSPYNITTSFHHLEQELCSMKSNHQHMAKVLQVKSTNETNLQTHLAQLKEAHTQLENKYNSLSTNHIKLTKHSQDIQKKLQEKHHELQVLQTKDGAISAELAMRLGKEETQQCELRELMLRLKEEQRERALVETELEDNKRKLSQLQEEKKELTTTNRELAKQLAVTNTEKQSLLQESYSLRNELSMKEKQLVEVQTKETSLCDQLVSKLALLELEKEKYCEVEARWREEDEKNRELQHQINLVKKKSTNDATVLQNMTAKSIELQRLLEEEQTKNHTLEGELASMRDKVQAAKDGLAYLQRGKVNLKGAPQATNDEVDELKESNAKFRHFQQCSPKESTQLMSPTIHDVLCIQDDTIQHLRQLLHKATTTKHFIKHISEMPSSHNNNNYSFQSILQLLEKILTSHIKISNNVNYAIDFEETCQSELSSLFDISLEELHSANLERNTPIHEDSCDLISHKQLKKLTAATRSHLKKIESLHCMAMELKPVKLESNGLDPNVENKHAPMHVANEIVSIFQEAMAALLEDTKLLVSVDDA